MKTGISFNYMRFNCFGILCEILSLFRFFCLSNILTNLIRKR